MSLAAHNRLGGALHRERFGASVTSRAAAGTSIHQPHNQPDQSAVYWDELIAIEPDGHAEVFDLTVEGLHNFIADGLLAHNSIEQDADIVMFIFREEEYKASDENRGLAEIIIAKQRNGPTGTIKLAFLKEFTRFENFDWRAGS